MYKYKYIDETERNFPTLGIIAKKDDIIESEEKLNNPFLQEINEATQQTQEQISEEIQVEEAKLAELKAEETNNN